MEVRSNHCRHRSRSRGSVRALAMSCITAAIATAPPAHAASFFVTNTDPDGTGGVFEALADTTANPGPDEIVFAVGSQTIFMTSPLPIANGVTLRAQGGMPTLDGSNSPSTTRGVVMQGSDTRVEGIAIRNYPNVAIEIRGTNAVVDDCRLSGTQFGVLVLAGAGDRNILIGDEVAAGNFIYGNTFGISVDPGVQGVRIVRNVIGIDESDVVVANQIGVVAGGTGDQVIQNVISGNAMVGLSIPGNQVRAWGNNIGLTRDEMGAAPNATGVFVTGTEAELGLFGLSGTQGAPNVISGNTGAGILIGGTGAVLAGNRIGLHRTLALAFPNGGDGVLVSGGSDNGIGSALAGNEIGANGGHGVYIQGSFSFGNFLNNNVIGGDFPNAGSGARIEGPDNELVGNTIAKNTHNGVEIAGPDATFNKIFPNRIEDNQGAGVRIVDASDNQIQGATASGKPVIRRNGRNGIEVVAESGTAKQNSIRQVEVTGNDAFGIALFPSTQNDIEPPTTDVAPTGGAFGAARPDAIIDLYADAAEEGEFYIDSIGVDGSGNWSSLGSLVLWAGMNLTATQTDLDANTSEFSVPVRIPPAGGPNVPPMPGDTLCLSALDAAQVVPPSGSAASGTATVAVEEAGQAVALRIDHSVTNATAAEIRMGSPGENGPLALDLGPPTSPLITTLSGVELHAFTAGDHYLLISSAAEPTGEIRGVFLCPEPGALLQALAVMLALGLRARSASRTAV